MLGADPETGLPVVAKAGRYGPYVTEVLPDDAPKSAKPRTGSLLSTMSLDTVTLDDALRLLTPAAGGRRRPGGRRGDHRAERPLRAVPQEGHRLAVAGAARSSCSTITLDEALAIYAQPKHARRAARPPRRCGSSAPTRSPGCPIVVKEGRFGAYVTDGETQRDPAQGRLGRGRDDRAGGRAARREAGQGPGPEEAGRQEDDSQEDDARRPRQEDRQEGRRQEVLRRGRRGRDRRRGMSCEWIPWAGEHPGRTPRRTTGRDPRPRPARRAAHPGVPAALDRPVAVQPR